MSSTSLRARKLAKLLLRENNKYGRSWRDIAGDFPPNDDGKCLIKAGTLNRIANSNGEWLPKDESILLMLGLIKLPKPRSPFAGLPKWFERTDAALAWFNGQREKVKQMNTNTRASVMKAKGMR